MATAFPNTNRLVGLLDEVTHDPVPRTPAQREASRRNGVRSCGPKTAEGKSRSRLNAIRHGLLAKVIVPPSDVRGHDRLFMRIRGELIAELKPKRFSEFALIDGLAADHLQLARVRSMTEALQRSTTNPKDAEQWRLIQEAERDLRLMNRALPGLLAEVREPACTAAQADRIARRFTEFVRTSLDDWSQHEREIAEAAEEQLAASRPRPGPCPPGGADAAPGLEAFEREELASLERRVALIRPMRRKL